MPPLAIGDEDLADAVRRRVGERPGGRAMTAAVRPARRAAGDCRRPCRPRHAPGAAAARRRRRGARPGVQRLPRAGARPAGHRGRCGGRAAVGRRLHRLAAGHRLDPAARRPGGGPRRLRRCRGRAGLLLRLPGQPRRPDRAGGAGVPARLRSPQPRLGRRRRPALSCGGPGRRAPGRGGRGPGAVRTYVRPGGRGHRRGVLRRRRPGAARRAARGHPARTARCSWSTRRTRSGSSATRAAGRLTRPGWPARRTSS